MRKGEPKQKPAVTKLELAPGQSPHELLMQVTKGGKGNKFGAKKTNGYDSQMESDYADKLRLRVQAGELLDFLEQVPIRLTKGGERITYRVDFMLLHKDGTCSFVEVKGHETKEYLIKMKLLRNERPEIARRLQVVGKVR